MVIFNSTKCIDICLKNSNQYVALAVEDLKKDFARISVCGIKPNAVLEETNECIIIEENDTFGEAAVEDESFSIKSDSGKIKIKANGYLGTIWGIYTFSEKILGVDPCYLFNDLETQKKTEILIEEIDIEEKPEHPGFRGCFINDEDLLTEWKEGGGKRPIDYPWYQTTVAETAMNAVVETALRLKLNLVIPASLLDIDNPPEKALADCVAKRGIFLSQHHIEPLGLSHFTFERYVKRFGKQGGYSFIENPETLIEGWKYYAEKWSEYDNVVWQIGLRGKADRPVWEEEQPSETELIRYSAHINRALTTQRDIILRATGGKAKYFSTTLWMEGSVLMEKGLLQLPKNTIVVFSDNGPNQMFGKDYEFASRVDGYRYGVYYHVQYFDIGPHLAPQTGLNKLYYNLKKAKDKGDDDYFILNVSNVREFDFEIKAYAQMLWNIRAFEKTAYLDNYASVYGEESTQAKKFVNAYFDNLPCISTEYLRFVHAKYFNYNYEETATGVKNFILKDGLILRRGLEIVWSLRHELPNELYQKMYEELKKKEIIYERLSEEIDVWSKSLPTRLRRHTKCKWWLYSKALLHFYRWFISVYEAKQAYDNANIQTLKEKLRSACESLEEYLSLRKCAEYGEFENWFKGDTKLNVPNCLREAQKILHDLIR